MRRTAPWARVRRAIAVCRPRRRGCSAAEQVLQWAQYYCWADIAQTTFRLICGLAGPPAPPSTPIAGPKRASPCKQDHDTSGPSTLPLPNLGSRLANWKICFRTTGCSIHNNEGSFPSRMMSTLVLRARRARIRALHNIKDYEYLQVP